MRLRKKKCTPLRLQQLNDYFIKTEEGVVLNTNEIFGNKNQIHIEIGAGKGKFITTLAKENPTINYIAFEKSDDVIAMAAMKAIGLPNIKFVNCDAQIVDTIFEKNTISQIYLNFSDPWKKGKQAKRRLTHRNFLEKYKQILDEDGEIHFKTDNRPLFDFSIIEMQEFGMTLILLTYDLHKENMAGNIMTEYEERFSSMGVPINKVIAKFENI